MMVAMREEMTSLQVHNVEQFASQLQAIESKNEILSRNMEQVIAYENAFSEFARKKFESIIDVFTYRCNTIPGGSGNSRPPPYPFVDSQPAPPVILKMGDPSVTVERTLHCGFCNTDFTGDVGAHKKACWPIHARLKIQILQSGIQSGLIDPHRSCPMQSRICGDCIGCYFAAATYVYMGRLRL